MGTEDALPRPAHVPPVDLSVLAGRHGLVLAGGDTPGAGPAVTGITASSDRVRPGDVFAALPGAHTHGARFAEDAVRSGALAVITDRAGADLVADLRVDLGVDLGVAVLVADDVRAALGPVSSSVYGEPSQRLRIFGVTGTSGKTTTTYFLRSGLRAAGRRTGLIGTVATEIGDEQLSTGFTTPEAPEVHALLAVMAERGVTDVAMEVSSHALALGRVGGVAFDVAGFTNLSQDHLDFHPDMEDYFAAKRRLFDERATAVVVVDDEWGQRLARELPHAITVSTRAGLAAAWRVQDVSESGASTTFLLQGPGDTVNASTSIPGRFNVANASLAIAMLHAGGLGAQDAAGAVATATVPGRMERIDAGQAFLAVVDYSHKPAAIDGALRALRARTSGRLIVVLGCGGDRDRAKRPVMGELAARASDELIVTDDNPRSEDPASIRAAMLGGAMGVAGDERAQVCEIGDRRAAIAHAVGHAGPGDTVLVAGKGHEQGQEIAGVIHPFDDRVVLREEIEAARR